jgi:predicted PurR-regulated permease PerM
VSVSEGTSPEPPASTPADDTLPEHERRGDRRRGERRRRIDWRSALNLGAGVAIGLLLASLVGSTVIRLQGLLVTLIIALFLSFSMEPAVQYLARRGVRRGAGTLLVFLGAFLLLVGFLAAMAPLVVGQVRNLVDAGPTVLDDLARQAQELPGQAGAAVSDWLMRQAEEAPDRIPEIAGELGRRALGVGSTLAGVIVQMLTVALITFYLVADGPKLRRVLSSRLTPATQREFLEVWELAIAKTGGYVYSRVLTAVASAIFHIAAFSFIGVPYPAALGVFVGIVSSLIPVVGTYLAGTLPLLIALSDAPITALWVLVVIVVYQQVENYLISPKISEATLELHPAVAFVSVLVGAALLGAAGALLALPAAAIVTALVSTVGERHEVMEHGLTRQHHEERRQTRNGPTR